MFQGQLIELNHPEYHQFRWACCSILEILGGVAAAMVPLDRIRIWALKQPKPANEQPKPE
jgi:hypothetical protein